MTRKPTFRINYNGEDISEAIAPYVTSLQITDNKEGQSDEVSLTVENGDRRWMASWFPDTGAVLRVRFGYADEPLAGPIAFELDEPEYSGPPDICNLKGVATPITKALREKNTIAYEETTLDAIAQQIADKHGLELVGNVPSIKLDRVTQKDESDLQFLRDLADEYGLVFKVESLTKLVFYSESELENADAIATIKIRDIKSYRLSKKAAGTYTSATIRYLNPESGEYDEVKIDASGAILEEAEEPTPETPETPTATPDADGEEAIATEDSLNISERFESLDQAKIRATEALRRANRGQIEGSLQMDGNPTLSAGTNITLKGFRRLGGKYQIEKISHDFNKSSGYSCSVDLKGIELNDDEDGADETAVE